MRILNIGQGHLIYKEILSWFIAPQLRLMAIASDTYICVYDHICMYICNSFIVIHATNGWANIYTHSMYICSKFSPCIIQTDTRLYKLIILILYIGRWNPKTISVPKLFFSNLNPLIKHVQQLQLVIHFKICAYIHICTIYYSFIIHGIRYKINYTIVNIHIK